MAALNVRAQGQFCGVLSINDELVSTAVDILGTISVASPQKRSLLIAGISPTGHRPFIFLPWFYSTPFTMLCVLRSPLAMNYDHVAVTVSPDVICAV